MTGARVSELASDAPDRVYAADVAVAEVTGVDVMRRTP
jgi:hypothetical protein